MAFSGWPAAAVEFFEGLRADNSKTYWTAHKQVYNECVHAPMAALLGELESEFGPGRIARPHRDVRFSPDKSPYKTAIYATLEGGGYINVSADGLIVGNGYHMMATDQLDRYRNAVDAERTGTALAAIVDKLRNERIEAGGAEELRGAPRGYPKDHPRLDLLRHKGLIAWRQWPVASWLGTVQAKRRVVDFLRTTAPLQAWLDEHVGPTR